MPFRKENDPAAPLNAAAFADQAEPDSVDFDILASSIGGVGVVSGCRVTPNGPPDMTVLVDLGVVRIIGNTIAVAAGSVAIGAAGALPRFDLIVVDSAGVLSAVSGPTDANPVYASIPANSVVLAAVYVPVGTVAIDADRITDKTTRLVPGVSREYWAVVDTSGDGDYRTIQQAIDAQARSIFVREGTLQPGFTILATDAVTRIVGATPGDGSLVTPGVQIVSDVTIQKPDVLIEQMLFNNVFAAVTVNVEDERVVFLACAWSGGILAANTSTINVTAGGNDLLLLFCQARGNPGGSGDWLSFSGAAARPKLIQCIIRDYSGTTPIVDDGGFNIQEGQITATSFIDNAITETVVDSGDTVGGGPYLPAATVIDYVGADVFGVNDVIEITGGTTGVTERMIVRLVDTIGNTLTVERGWMESAATTIDGGEAIFIVTTNFMVRAINSLFWNVAGCTIVGVGVGGGFIHLDAGQVAGNIIDAGIPNRQTLIRGNGVFTGNTLLNCSIAIDCVPSPTSSFAVVASNLIVNITPPNIGIGITLVNMIVVISSNLVALKAFSINKASGATMVVTGNLFLVAIVGSESFDSIFGNSGSGGALDIRGRLFSPEVDDEIDFGSTSRRFRSLFLGPAGINDQALGRGTLVLAAGVNPAITMPDFAGPISITGPGAPFSIDGILSPPGTGSPGDQAKQFILINDSGQVMTIVNESAAVPAFGATIERRIHTMTGANVVITPGVGAGDRGCAIFIFESIPGGPPFNSRWLLIGTQG